ncbi:hypothetical protein [Acinetobacter sp. CWB-B33]|uniref:hypothetical protein n=1 Tax=Acinetobacter sp. CWB-B33 TaxID=2815724 RepID=UPI0031FECD89
MLLNKSVKQTLLVTSIMALLTACGGGGGDSGSAAAPFTSKPISGTAVDFYLANATVQLDDCKDSAGNPVFVKTDAAGNFKFNTTENCQNSAITVTGGTDIATGLPFTGTLKLKKTNLQAINSNTAVITPLTTLQSYLGAANNADIKPLLEKLGLSSSTITKLQAANFDLSQFDPAKDATAQDMAIIFTVQQLATQIEDSLQAVSKGDGTNPIDQDEAAKIAFGAILNQLQTAPLFTPNSLIIDGTALNAVLTQAVTDAGPYINDPAVTINQSVVDQIHTSITIITSALNNIVASGTTAESLQDAITSNQGGIKDSIAENLKTPVYSEFSLAHYSLADLKNSSSASPLNIDLGTLNTVLSVDFKLNNTQKELSDTVKLAFKLRGQSGAQTEDLNVTVNNVTLNFNANGSIKSATIPAGTKINIITTFNGVNNTSFTLNKPVDITSANGTVSLQNLIDSNTTLEDFYNQYVDKLKANDTVQVSAFVLPITYVIDANLGLATGAVDFGGDNYLASTLTAYFKLN